jgi:rhodanese-related sulfurtransferase
MTPSSSSLPPLLVLDVREEDEVARTGLLVPGSVNVPVSRPQTSQHIPPTGPGGPPVVIIVGGQEGDLDARQMYIRLVKVVKMEAASIRVLNGGYGGWERLKKEFLR